MSERWQRLWFTCSKPERENGGPVYVDKREAVYIWKTKLVIWYEFPSKANKSISDHGALLQQRGKLISTWAAFGLFSPSFNVPDVGLRRGRESRLHNQWIQISLGGTHIFITPPLPQKRKKNRWVIQPHRTSDQTWPLSGSECTVLFAFVTLCKCVEGKPTMGIVSAAVAPANDWQPCWPWQNDNLRIEL